MWQSMSYFTGMLCALTAIRGQNHLLYN
jgi:hypothetical protein